jgi:beta-N-acetylglucosaminidase
VIIRFSKYYLLSLLWVIGLFSVFYPMSNVEAATTNGEWKAQYYGDDKFGGEPIVKSHAALDFNWGSNSPDNSIPKNFFSARFTNVMEFENGVYRLIGEVDDKVRVYIDNQLIYEIDKAGHHMIDEWVEVPVGNHEVHVEYVELSGNAKLSLEFEKPEGWTAKYYDNVNFKGSPLIKNHPSEELSHNWGSESPGPGIPTNYFSAEFEKDITFKGGVYHLTGKVDDLAKVYIDNKLVYEINKAGSHTVSKLIEVPQGNHQIRVQYTEYTGGAKIALDFTEPEGWVAKYYDNVDLQGMPIIKEHDELDFSWGYNSPASTIPTNYFSATFEKEISFKGGEYYIAGNVDDAVNVYIDGQLVYGINNAGNHKLNKLIDITPGTHKIYVEYKEFTGAAGLSLDFIQSNGWLAKYYPNEKFKGTPIYDSISKLNQNWSGGSPHSSIPSDYFSAEFVKNMNFEGGVYNLTGKADDLIKVYIDDKLVYDINSAGNHTFNKLVEISKGNHEVRVQYVEYTGGAKVSLDFTRPDGWVAKYYNNTKLQGSPVIKEHTDVNLNWKSGSPAPSIPADNFSAILEKNINFEGGMYKLVGQVDDKLKVYVDNKLVYEINQPGHHMIDTLIEIPNGNHQIRFQYVELSGNAKLSLDFDSPQGWVGKYYDNKDLQGTPVLKEHDALSFDWSYGSPASTIPSDYFSATYERTLTFEGGIYQLAGRSDDLVKVYIDNQLVYDITQPGSHKLEEFIEIPKGKHNVRVEYVELTGGAKLSLDFVKSDGWVAKYYDNTSMQGTPILKVHEQLNFSWESGSPHHTIPANHFSATFENELTFEGGLYRLIGNVDDSLKVYVDDKLVYEMTDIGSHKISDYVNISEGTHKIRVEYTEYTGAANLSLDFVKQKGIVKEYQSTSYSTNLQSMVNTQVNAKAQIDPFTYDTYIRSDGFISISDGVGTIDYNYNWALRDGPGTNFWEVTRISSSKSNPYSLRILDEVKGSDGYIWYEVNYYGWQNAKPSAIEQLVNPLNYSNKDSREYLQFLKLSGSTGLDISEVNSTVLANKGILTNQAATFIQAGIEYNVNEAYLIAHALLETGNGTSRLATGVGIVVENGTPRLANSGEKPDKYVYNMYGINAKDSCPLECGALYAYERGWFTPEKAIVGGAFFIAEDYISVGQDTLYKMRWNPENPGSHQYATDIGWAIKQTFMIHQVYSQLYNYTLIYDVPVFN